IRRPVVAAVDAESTFALEEDDIDFHHHPSRSYEAAPLQISRPRTQGIPQLLLQRRPDDEIVQIGRLEQPVARGADKSDSARTPAHDRGAQTQHALQTDEMIRLAGGRVIRLLRYALPARQQQPLLYLPPELDGTRQPIVD